MVLAPVIPALKVSGELADTWAYGTNASGPWRTDKKWTREQWAGLDGPRVAALIELANLWVGLACEVRLLWCLVSRRALLPGYTYFVGFNMRRFICHLPFLSTPP